MATRFYTEDTFSSASIPGGPETFWTGITPTQDAGWTTVSFARRPLHTQARRQYGNTPGFAVAGAGAIGSRLHRQFISAPLAADTTISGTVKGMMMLGESALTDNYFAASVWRVVTAAGAARGTLLSDLTGLGNEAGTTQASLKVPGGWTGSGTAITTVNALQGDHVVVEVGWFQNSTSVGNASLRWGSGQGATTSPDFSETEGDTNQSHVTWFEFSTDIPLLESPSVYDLLIPWTDDFGPG